MDKTALVLLSGGLDSATAAAVALDQGFDITALTFAYGQRHQVETRFAGGLVKRFGVRSHLVVDIQPEVFSATALMSGSSLAIPKNREIDGAEIPVTYVPARNILFLSYALAIAESRGILDIFIGVNAMDYSGYPDCRPEFIESFEAMANIGTRAGVEGKSFHIHAPLMAMKKSEIIKLGSSLGVDYSLTHSCYDPDPEGFSCGECDSCLIRKKGFHDAGVPDPTRYRMR
ncbi:MAG TPA: 7-cyano-7-deazaguanine synthase QueC [Spirochaetes bacterium]|nr:7-cyano-7-deazaguanine synthase QueC [Spirochaetota bacterium]